MIFELTTLMGKSTAAAFEITEDALILFKSVSLVLSIIYFVGVLATIVFGQRTPQSESTMRNKELLDIQ